MKRIDKKKMKLLQNIIELNIPLDEEEGLTVHKKDEEGYLIEMKLETVFVNKILDIANIQPIELAEKECLYNEIISLVCEIKNGSLDYDDEVGLTHYEKDDEGNIKETKVESVIVKIILDIVDMQEIEEEEKRLLFNAILSLVCEVKNTI